MSVTFNNATVFAVSSNEFKDFRTSAVFSISVWLFDFKSSLTAITSVAKSSAV